MIERKQKAPLKSVRIRKKTKFLINKAKSKSRSNIRKQKKQELYDQITTRSPQTRFMNSFKNKVSSTRRLNTQIKQKIDEVNLRINQQKVRMIKEMEKQAKQKIRHHRNQHSMDAIKQKYLQKKTVSPHTLHIKKNEDVHFVETHCFCIPKHLAHHFHDPKPLLKKNKELLQQKLQQEKLREAQYQNAKFNQQRNQLNDYDRLDEQVEEQKNILLEQLLEAQKKELQMMSRFKKLNRQKGKMQVNRSVNDFTNKDMLKEFEKNNKKLFKEIKKSKSALNLQRKKQRQRFKQNQKKMYKLKKKVYSNREEDENLNTFNNFNAIDKNQNLVSTDFTNREGDSTRFTQTIQNNKLVDDDHEEKLKNQYWDKLQNKSLSQYQLDKIDPEGNDQIHEIYQLNKNPKYHDNFINQKIPQKQSNHIIENNNINQTGGTSGNGQMINRNKSNNLDYLKEDNKQNSQITNKNKNPKKSSQKNKNDVNSNNLNQEGGQQNQNFDISQRSLNGKVMINSHHSDEDEYENKEGFVNDYDYLSKNNDENKYEFTGISEKDLQRIQNAKRHSKDKNQDNLDYIKQQNTVDEKKRFTFNNNLPEIKNLKNKKDSHMSKNDSAFDESKKYSIVNDSDKKIPNYSFNIDNFSLHKDSNINNLKTDSNIFDNPNNHEQLFSLVSSQLYGNDSQILSSATFVQNINNLDKESKEFLQQDDSMYHNIMKSYLTHLYDSIFLKQFISNSKLYQTASWNLKNKDSSWLNENNLTGQDLSNVNKDYLLDSFNNKSDIHLSQQKKKNSKSNFDKDDDMFLNSKLSFGPNDQSKLKDKQQGSIKDYLQKSYTDQDKKDQLSNRYFDQNSKFDINNNLQTQEFARDDIDQMPLDSQENSITTDYKQNQYSNNQSLDEKNNKSQTDLQKKFDLQTNKDLFKKKKPTKDNINKKNSTKRKKQSNINQRKSTRGKSQIKNDKSKSINKTFKEDTNRRQSSQIKNKQIQSEKNNQRKKSTIKKTKKKSHQKNQQDSQNQINKTNTRKKSTITKKSKKKSTIIKSDKKKSNVSNNKNINSNKKNDQNNQQKKSSIRKKSTLQQKKLIPEKSKKDSIFQNQDLKGIEDKNGRKKSTTIRKKSTTTRKKSTTTRKQTKKSNNKKLKPIDSRNSNLNNNKQNLSSTLKVDYEGKTITNENKNDQNNDLQNTIRNKSQSKYYNQNIDEYGKVQGSTSNLSIYTQNNEENDLKNDKTQNSNLSQKRHSLGVDLLQVNNKYSIEGSQKISKKKVGSYMDINRSNEGSQVKVVNLSTQFINKKENDLINLQDMQFYITYKRELLDTSNKAIHVRFDQLPTIRSTHKEKFVYHY